MNTKLNFEFCKLDSIDLKVTSWLWHNCPRALHSYLKFIAENDYRRQGVKINISKVYSELLKVHKTAEKNMASDVKYNRFFAVSKINLVR